VAPAEEPVHLVTVGEGLRNVPEDGRLLGLVVGHQHAHQLGDEPARLLPLVGMDEAVDLPELVAEEGMVAAQAVEIRREVGPGGAQPRVEEMLLGIDMAQQRDGAGGERMPHDGRAAREPVVEAPQCELAQAMIADERFVDRMLPHGRKLHDRTRPRTVHCGIDRSGPTGGRHAGVAALRATSRG